MITIGSGYFTAVHIFKRICKNYSSSKSVIFKLTIRKAMAALLRLEAQHFLVFISMTANDGWIMTTLCYH